MKEKILNILNKYMSNAYAERVASEIMNVLGEYREDDKILFLMRDINKDTPAGVKFINNVDGNVYITTDDKTRCEFQHSCCICPFETKCMKDDFKPGFLKI